MTSRERVAAALRREQPDRVPFCELGVDQALAEQILGRDLPPHPDLETNPRSLADEIELAERLGKDNICYTLRAPVYATKARSSTGTAFYTEGLIRSHDDLGMIALPDPNDERLYQTLAEWAAYKGDFSLWMVTRIGFFPTMLSLGMERFCTALYDDPGLVGEGVEAEEAVTGGGGIRIERGVLGHRLLGRPLP